jgi:methylthioribose-1-phosphate isomerase
MRVDGTDFRTIWLNDDGESVDVIDQTRLPHRFEILTLRTAADAEDAIKRMVVRGAPLIGATAAYGMALAARADASDPGLKRASERLFASRPTRV